MDKTILGIPTFDGTIRIELAEFLRETAADTVFVPVVHRPTHIARNQLVRQSISQKRNLVMVDADTIPPKHAFAIINAKIHEEVCACGLPYRAATGQICVGETSPRPKEVEHFHGLAKVDNIGTGCIGYNYRVWDDVPYPWFDYDLSNNCSEDYVCHRKLKCPIYCLWTFWADHIVTRTISKERSLTDFEKQILMAGL